MNGIRPDGSSVTYHRRGRDRPPPGPLDADQVAETRAMIAGGLKRTGRTALQIGQVLKCSERGVRRLLRQDRRRREREAAADSLD